MADFSFIIIFLIVILGGLALLFGGTRLFRPHSSETNTTFSPYECSEIAIDTDQASLKPYFIRVSIASLIFLAQIIPLIFLVPLLHHHITQGHSLVIFISIFSLLLFLSLELLFIWKKAGIQIWKQNPGHSQRILQNIFKSYLP